MASPSPSTSSTRSGKRSRAQASLDSDVEYEQDAVATQTTKATAASRKRKTNSAATAPVTANGVNKKELRMERNRQAAQASRDRRKAYTEELEVKVQQLEAQLASKTPAPPTTPSADLERLAELEAENAMLRSQLAASQTEGAQVQARMESFESKLEWLTQVMYNQSQSQQQATSVPSPTQSVSPLQLQQSSPSPPMPNLSLDPQTLLSLLPQPQQPLPSSSVPSSLVLENRDEERVEQIDSLVAREPKKFLPRIPICSTTPLLPFSLPQQQQWNCQAKKRLRTSLGSLPFSNRNLNGRNMINRYNNSRQMDYGSINRLEDIRRKRFLVLRFLSEKKGK